MFHLGGGGGSQHLQQQPKYGEARLAQIKDIAGMLIAHRRDVSMQTYGEEHDCVRTRCGPYTCEMDLPRDAKYKVRNPCVYVCRMGQIHLCTADECTHYLGTHEGTCTLTNLYHGHTRGDTGYVPPDKRTWHFKRGDTKAIPQSAQLGKEHGFAAPPPMVLEYRRRFNDSQKDHTLIQQQQQQQQQQQSAGKIVSKFDLATFDPFKLAYAGSSAAPPQPPPPEVMEAPIATVKAPTIKEEKNVFPTIQRHGKTGPPKKRRLNRELLAQESEVARLSEIAESIVIALLFSDKRQQYNMRKRAVLEGQRDQAIALYYETRKRVIPIAVEVAEIVARHEQHALYLAILPRNNELIAYYVRVVLETWRVIVNSPWADQNPGASFEGHAMTILYVLKRGLTVKEYPVIVRDAYMDHLPARNDLPYFGERFVPAVVTSGMKNVRQAYEMAHTIGGTPVESLVLRVRSPKQIEVVATARGEKRGK